MRGFKPLFFVFALFIGAFAIRADEPDSNIGHIGIEIDTTASSQGITVNYVAAKSPAAIAGMKKGDLITAVDGISTRGMSRAKALGVLIGKIGTVVKLSIGNESSTKRQLSILRRSLTDTYMAAANAGDPRAEFLVGTFHYDRGDAASAVAWYRKSAAQGFAKAEADLGFMYAHGLGVPMDPKAAFAWFYSAAEQDDPLAESYLGRLYREGQGVAQNYRDAFNWYYRSAENGDGYAAWGLAYMYEDGLGVRANLREALKWYQQAEAALPDNEALKKAVAGASMRAFLQDHDFASLDVSLILPAFQRPIFIGFIALSLVYVAGGVALLCFSLKRPEGPDAPPKLFVALGWITFYVESQGVALLAIFVFGKALTAETLFLVTTLVSALPVLASTCGPLRSRIWRASRVPWKALLPYAGGACVAILVIGLGYQKAHALFTHSSLPPQPTSLLIGKAKSGSAWATYACIGCIMPAAEEVLFRYYLFDALRRRFSGRIVVVVTALAFSFVHFQMLYFVPLFGYGLALGWVRLKTDSLRLPILLHAMNNCLFLALSV